MRLERSLANPVPSGDAQVEVDGRYVEYLLGVLHRALGGYVVLSVGNDVYRLDRADLVHGYEGQRVVVTGSLDEKLKQIHVVKIDLEH